MLNILYRRLSLLSVYSTLYYVYLNILSKAMIIMDYTFSKPFIK